MVTDRELHQDVVDALQRDPSVHDAEIAVGVKDGVVTLGGFVESYAEKHAAERVVEMVAGVKAIAEELQVRVPSAMQRTDTEIAHAALNALRWSIQVPDDGIRVKVEDGWLTLDGEVQWYYQSAAAERAVRHLTGVRGVANLVHVKRRDGSSAEVAHSIREALRRHAALDLARIRVEAHDGRVILTGQVRSWAERREVEHAAWSAPGVKTVDDRITVGA